MYSELVYVNFRNQNLVCCHIWKTAYGMFVVCSNGKHNCLYIVHSEHRSDHSTEGGATYCCIVS